jgi:hypothetical protein
MLIVRGKCWKREGLFDSLGKWGKKCVALALRGVAQPG